MRTLLTNPHTTGFLSDYIRWEDWWRAKSLQQKIKYTKHLKNKYMFKLRKPGRTSVKRNKSYQGETIEQKINRIVNNKEPIKDGAPLIYQERHKGVDPACDIRTDRFELATEAMDKVTKSHLAKRDHRIGEKTYDTMTPDQQAEFHKKYPHNKFNKPKTDGGPESTQATDPK